MYVPDFLQSCCQKCIQFSVRDRGPWEARSSLTPRLIFTYIMFSEDPIPILTPVWFLSISQVILLGKAGHRHREDFCVV